MIAALVPKVELHAHLHGSIRESTLRVFLEEEQRTLELGVSRTLEDCFRMFAAIHEVVNTEDRVRRIAREAVQDMARDHVVYVEFRSTPRALPGKWTKYEYVSFVVDELESAAKRSGIEAKLLLSIDRGSNSLEDALDTVELATKFEGSVVGIDFSGNPTKNDFKMYLESFERARELGLKTTVHFAEVFNEEDAQAILDFGPDRLGHACCLNESLLKQIVEKRIPIEICPTSNLMTRPEIKSYGNHPVMDFLSANHPISVCTDDSGVFGVSLTHEWARVIEAFNVPMSQVLRMVECSIEFIFSDEESRSRIRRRLEEFKLSHES
jgi:adenosine deaminase